MSYTKEFYDKVTSDIWFVTEKMEALKRSVRDSNKLDIHQMVDFHRYAETRLFLVKTLNSLQKDGEDDV